MSFAAGFKSESLIDFRVNSEEPLRLAVSRTLAFSIHELDKEIQKTVKRYFFFPGNPLSLREMSFTRSGKKGTGSRIFSASLSYNYLAVPLVKYPYSLVSVPQSNQTAKAVYVRIRKGQPAKLVHGKSLRFASYQEGGRIPYMGFMQKNPAKHIYERFQGKTWDKGDRLPIHALYAPSFTDLLKSPELENYFASSKPLQTLEDIFKKEIVSAT